ncbi:dermatopontin-like [Carassius gibelio]|uniref:dermatopontin-like n=1 Tax=Carassius gibelio TaxID=101364 RepID=UPI0022797686|nr:dermatopontin-like [Carassius gibelio]
MRRIALFLLLTGILCNGQELHWENNQSLEFKCHAGQSISLIKIQLDINHKDLTWEFGCKDTFASGADCVSSPQVNESNQTFAYECPPHHVLSGMSSYYSIQLEDRRWQFYCCRSNSRCTDKCEWITNVNGFEFFNVPDQKYLVGAESYSEKADRRWKYKYCSIVQC